MTRMMRFHLMVVVLVTLLALVVVAPIPGKLRVPLLSGSGITWGMDLAGGAELRYRMLFPTEFAGNPEQITRSTADVLRRRLESKLHQEPKVFPRGSEEIVIQLPGVDAQGLEECKRLLRKSGQLRIHAVASPELQERYARDGVLPDGYSLVQDRRGVSSLIEATPVIEGRHILDAEPRPEVALGTIRWTTGFNLDLEGAKRFDDAAERLYRRTPRGRMAIILDGEVQSAPVVQSPAFHGRGQISTSRE